jgi:septal ring factor EnvC (AmiA/AmiB activator)
MAITPNPAFEVNFTIGGDKTRQAISKYRSSKAEIYEYLNQLEGEINQLEGEINEVEDENSVTFSVNGVDI